MQSFFFLCAFLGCIVGPFVAIIYVFEYIITIAGAVMVMARMLLKFCGLLLDMPTQVVNTSSKVIDMLKSKTATETILQTVATDIDVYVKKEDPWSDSRTSALNKFKSFMTFT